MAKGVTKRHVYTHKQLGHTQNNKNISNIYAAYSFIWQIWGDVSLDLVWSESSVCDCHRGAKWHTTKSAPIGSKKGLLDLEVCLSIYRFSFILWHCLTLYGPYCDTVLLWLLICRWPRSVIDLQSVHMFVILYTNKFGREICRKLSPHLRFEQPCTLYDPLCL